MDTVWIVFDSPCQGSTKTQFPVLHIIDSATRFASAWLMENETSECAIMALKRAWIRNYGAPSLIQCDEARGFCGHKLQEFCSQENIALQMVPGEAHWKLGIIERRHPVLRKAIEFYLQDNRLPPNRKGIVQALDHVVPAMKHYVFYTWIYTGTMGTGIKPC